MIMIAFPKVLCIAVQGPAVGIGVILLLRCDIVRCSTTANFVGSFNENETRARSGTLDIILTRAIVRVKWYAPVDQGAIP
jgi:1,4-dihydroxy-2-naphthoyl-CoA synthase